MKVIGFSFIRNGIKYDYPFKEAIESILPLCSQVIVAVGNSEDATLSVVAALGDKIRIIETIWDDSLRSGGKVLAIETNKALAAVPADADWAVYIQGDEVIPEQYHQNILSAMHAYKDNHEVEGLVFNYLHFYGSYDYVGESLSWYRREVRVIRPKANIYSYSDAQGFRKDNDKKLNVKLIDAFVYHYGWVKAPHLMQKKAADLHRYWHSDEWIKKNVPQTVEFDYTGIDALRRFEDKHPKVMQARIAEKNWKFDFDPAMNRFSTKEKIKRFIEKYTGYRIGEFKNYKII